MATTVRAEDTRGARSEGTAGDPRGRPGQAPGPDTDTRRAGLGAPEAAPAVTRITLPFPPSVNHYWRNIVMGRSPRTLISARGREYRVAVLAECMTQRVRPLHGPIACTLDLYPPDLRRRDCDNYAKALLDALGHANAYGDDSQIIDLRVRMRDKQPPGRVVVTLSLADAPGAQLGLVT